MIRFDIRHLLLLAALIAGVGCTAQPTPANTAIVPTLAPTTTNTPAIATPTPTVAPSPTRTVPTPTPVRTPDLAALDTTITQMETSVRAGDGNGYLALVDTSDPFFAQEQRMWAHDLTEHPVTSYQLQHEHDRLEGNRAITHLTMVWKTGRTPQRSVQFDAAFTWQDNRWLYSGPNWSELRDGQITLKYFPAQESLARDLLPRIQPTLAKVADDLAMPQPLPVVIALYPNMALLQESIYLSYPSALGGWNEPGESIKLLVSLTSTAERLVGVLAHELTHNTMFGAGIIQNRAPWWLDEGMADLEASPYWQAHEAEDRITQLHKLAVEDALVGWGELANFNTTPPDKFDYAYLQGWSMMRYLTDKYGRAARNKFLHNLTSGTYFDDACLDAFGSSFTQIDAAWRTMLKKGKS